MFKIFIKKINKVSLEILCDEEIKESKNFKIENDKLAYLSGRYWIRSIVGDYFKMNPKDLTFNIDKNGRPSIINIWNKNLDFNISHSDEFVILAMSNRLRVGIDIEKIRDIDIDLISYNCFSNKEKKYLKEKNDKLVNFFKIWTLKESYLKALGCGLVEKIKDISFYFDKYDEPFLLKGVDNKKWDFRCFLVNDKYMTSVCSSKNDFFI